MYSRLPGSKIPATPFASPKPLTPLSAVKTRLPRLRFFLAQTRKCSRNVQTMFYAERAARRAEEAGVNTGGVRSLNYETILKVRYRATPAV